MRISVRKPLVCPFGPPGSGCRWRRQAPPEPPATGMIRGWHGSPALPIRWPERVFDIGAVPHGFRSSFRDWAAECSDAPREVCELALARVNLNSIEAAYRRTDLFERRRALMEQWAAFLAGGGPAV